MASTRTFPLRLDRWRAFVLAGALLAGSAPLLLSRAVPWRDIPALGSGLDPMQQAAILHYTLEHLPLRATDWSAPFFWPAPCSLAYMDPLVGQAVLVAWLPGVRANPALAYNAALAITLALAFGATVLLARRAGAGRGGAWLAGWAYALSPYAASHFMHLNQLPSPWLPLAMLGMLLLARRRQGGAVVLAGALLAQLASGLYAMAAACLACAVMLPCLASRLRRREWLVLSGVLLAVAAATWIWSRPYVAAAAAVPGYTRTAAQSGPFSARVFDLAHPPGSHLLPWPRALANRSSLYPGWLWTMLAAAGAALLWRSADSATRRWQCGLALAALAGLVLSFGRSLPLPGLGETTMPFAWLQDALWPLRAIRAPSRFFVVVTLPLALCGGVGAAALAKRVRGRRRAAALLPVPMLMLVLAALLELAPGPIQRVAVTPQGEERQIVELLAHQPHPTPWISFPQPQGEIREGPQDARSMLWAALSGQPVAGGSSGFVPAEVRALRAACYPSADAACLQALSKAGVRLAIVPRDMAPGSGAALPVLLEGSHWRVVRIP
jgi:hypothetical protein